MMRSRVAIAAILLVASPAGLFAQTLRREGSISLPAGVSAAPPAALSGNAGVVAAICSDDVVREWALPSGELVHTLNTKADPTTGLQFSNDGRLLAIAAKTGTIKVWDVVSWKVQQEFSVSAPAYVLAISPDNQLLAAVTDYDVQVWELSNQKRLATLHSPLDRSNSVAFSPDGALLASADGDTAIRVYDARTGILRSTASDLLLESLALDFSRDGKSLFAGGADKTISIIDSATGKIRDALAKQAGTLRGLVASPDGKQIAAIYNLPNRFDDANIGVVLLWDLRTRTVRARIEKPGVSVVGWGFAGEHLLLIGNSGRELSIWSVQ